MAKGFHSVDNIVREALIEIRDFEAVNYAEAAHYLMKGFRDFQLFHNHGSIKEAWRPVTAINTCNFPEDLLRLIKVGVIVDGEFFPFTRADDLVNPSDPLDLSLTADENTTIDRTPSYGYGARAHNLEYYYKEDRSNRRVILNRVSVDKTAFADRQEVLFKYVSNGVEDFNTTYIPDDAANLLSSYVVYKLVSARPDEHNMNYIMLKKEDYIEAKRAYDMLEMPSLQDLEDMLYENSGQNVRR